MSKISIYEVVPVPKLADRLIGTSVGGQIEDVTYNFTLGELLNLFIPNIPANGLQGVLDIGNTATQDINLFGTITTTYLDVTDTANLFITYLNQETHIVGSVYDSLDLIGAAGAVLTSTGSGVQWVTLPPIFTPNLQQVLTVGNTANLDIILSANIVALDINTDTETVNNNITIDGTITDGYSSSGPVNQVLSSTGTKVKWVNLPVYSATSPLLFNSATGVFSIQQAGSTQSGYLSSSDWITFDGKQNAGNYITALTGEATANGPGSASIILNNSSVIAKVLTGLNVTGGSISAADSILTAFGKVQGQLNGLVGGVFFKGSWNALINNPTLTSSVGTQGWYYIVSVAGNTNLNGITDWQVGDWAIFNGTTWDKIDNTDSVTSVNGQIGAVNLTTDNIPEGATNLYYLDSRARAAISLTTIGTSGAATYNNTTGVLNIPSYLGGVSSFNSRTGAVVPIEGDYTLTELGDVTITTPIAGQVLKYNGTIWINDTDANTGTVTSVSFTLGSSGTDLNSSVVNSTTTPLITLNVPTASASSRGALSSADWTTFNSKESALTFSSPLVRTTNTISIPVATTSVDGYLSSTDWNTFNNKQATISLTTTGTSGAATFIGNTLNIPQYQASGTYVTSVTGTSPIVSSGGTTPAISIPAATGSVDGYLTSTDWTTFNNKANALSGTLNTVPKFTSASTIGDSNIKDNGSAVTVNATAGSFGALQVGNYNGNILMNTTNSSGGLIFQNTSSSNKLWDFSSYNNDINFNESGVATPVMTLKTGGNVGIKTTIPSFLLDVAGTFGATGIVTLGNLAGSGSRMVIADSSGVLSTQAITTGTVTAVTASSPLFSSGGNTPNITIQQSSGSQDGYLSSTDWTTFNNKQAAGNYITSLTGEATGSGPGAATVTLNNAAVTGKILTGINITGGTVLDTDSILIGFGKLQNQVNGLVGGSTYQGTWNANTNTPTLTSSVGTAGYYYIVSVAGNTNLNGITDWQVGDWAIFNGGVWQKVDNTDAVVSVNGQTGAVSLTTDNIPEGTTNLYYLDSRARAALSFAAGSGAYSSSTGVITIPTNTSQLTNGANFITLASLNGTSPIVYNNTTGNISINQSGTASNGYLSSTDWNTFNGKQGTITLTTTGTSGAATFISNTLNIPNYSTDLSGYVPYIGATTNLNLGSFNLISTDVTANGNLTLYGNITATKTVSSGSPYSFVVTQNNTNATDTGDGALYVNHILSGTGTGTELVTRSFIFSSDNQRTGGSVLSNGRVLYLVSSTQSGTTTTNLDQVYVEGGTMSGTVTNNRGVLVKTMQGTNQAAFVATGLTSSNRVHLLLGNYTLPTGAWGIYSALTDASYLQGNLLLGSATDDGVNKLQVTGATKITGQLTLSSTITNGTYTYTLPSATGTLSLTSDLSGYLPLTGGTLTGALGGTSANFSSTLQVGGNASSTITIGDAVASGTDANLRLRTGSTKYAWLIASQNNIAGFEITPSTTVGGTTFSTPALSILPTGAASFSNSVSASYGGTFVIPVESPASGSVALVAKTSNGGNDIFRWYDGATQLGVFKNSGNVGIGTTSPTGRLMLYQSSAGNVLQNIVSNQGGSTQVGINLSPSMTDAEVASNPAQASIYATDSNYGANIIFATKATGAVGNALTTRLTIASTGNVGIGTTSPQTLLHIVKSSNPRFDISTTDSYSTAKTLYLTQTGTTGIVEAYNYLGGVGLPLALNPSGGNVLIGTTTDAGYKLDVNGTGRFANSVNMATSSGFVGIGITNPNSNLEVYAGTGSVFRAVYSSANVMEIGNYKPTGTGGAGYQQLDVVASILSFQTGTAGGGSSTERMRISSTGVSTFNSTSAGSIIFNSTSQTYLSIQNSGTTVSYLGSGGQLVSGGGANDVALTSNANNILFATNGGTERMRITSGGNVGIGTASPTNLLHVKKDLLQDWLVFFENTNNTSPIYGLLMQFTGGTGGNNSSSYYYYGGDTNSQRFSVRGNGGIYNFQANDSNLSDIRTKKDIFLLESYWNKFKAIEIVKFKYIDQTHDDYNIGVIAQQVEKVAPEFIDTDYWENPTNKNQTEMKSVYTTDLYHATIKVLQETMIKVETLELQIKELQSQINK